MKSNRVELGNLCEVVTKGTTPTTLGKSFSSNGIPFLRVQNIQERRIVLDTDLLYIDEETDKMLERSRIKPRDVLLSIAGTIGRSAVVPVDAPRFNCNQAVAIIRIAQGIDPAFLCYWFDTQHAQNQIFGVKVTATISNLSLGQIKKLKVPLPPLPEQRRIAAILDKADAVRRKRQEAIRLTEEFLRSAFLEMFGDSVTNPKGWEIGKLDDVCTEIYRYPTFYGFEYTETGVPVVRIGNILSNGFLNPDLSEYVLIDPKVSQLFPRTKLELYDIVMAVRGDGSTVKRIGMVTSKNLVGANISPNLLRFQAKQETVTPIYLFYFMTSKGGQTLLERYVTRTAKKTITAQAIKTISICLPPYSLQQKFDKLVKTTWQMKQNVDKTSWESSRFFNALVQRAFRGEL